MYTIVLTIHSWARWLALIAGVGATLAALRGKVDGTNSLADRWALFAMTALDIQMLLGLILYFVLSPFTAEALKDFSAAMKNSGLRFWAVEHLAVMFAAVILAHVGRVLARKASTPAAKRTRLLICFGVATLLMFLRTPWPGLPNGRPLFRI
jgi:hypothetical protein